MTFYVRSSLSYIFLMATIFLRLRFNEDSNFSTNIYVLPLWSENIFEVNGDAGLVWPVIGEPIED